MAEEARYKTNAQRVVHRDNLIASLLPVMASKTSAEWIDVLEQAGVPCGPIHTIDQVFQDPQVIARGMQQELTRADGNSIPLVANPIKMSLTPPNPGRAPPALGADTEAELNSLLGLSDAQIKDLRAKGII
jgi:crotonobetainyl-CoA:carnitine CoA-transferase CaiB-like acyl-CoA transferase